MSFFSRKTLLASVLGILTCFFSFQLLMHDSLSRFVMADVAIQAESDLFLYFKMSNGLKKEDYEQWKQSFPAAVSSLWSTARVQMGNKIVPVLGFETLVPGKIRINNIVFRSYFADDIALNYKQLVPLLVPKSTGTSITVGENWITIENSSGPIQVIFKKPVRFSNFFIQYVIPVILALGMFFLIRRINFLAIPAIGDIFHRKVGAHKFRVELDGLRGIAALLVLFDHTLTPAPGSGRTGVWLFFILSGYLLSQPFVFKPERAIDWQYLSHYFRRRLARILPMYYVTVLVMFGFTGHYDTLWNHIVFLYPEAHLWTIPQEMLFYLLLPLIMGILFCVGLLGRSLVLLLLGAVAAILIYHPELMPFTMFASGIAFPPYIGWFLAGVFVSFLRPDRIQEWLHTRAATRFVISTVALCALITVLALSFPRFTFQFVELPHQVNIFLGSPPNYTLICVALFPLVLATPGSLVSRILSLRVFRSIGIVGYSFYLLHAIIIDLYKGVVENYFGISPENLALALPVAVLTWLAAVFTYSLIERPFLYGTGRVVASQGSRT